MQPPAQQVQPPGVSVIVLLVMQVEPTLSVNLSIEWTPFHLYLFEISLIKDISNLVKPVKQQAIIMQIHKRNMYMTPAMLCR